MATDTQCFVDPKETEPAGKCIHAKCSDVDVIVNGKNRIRAHKAILRRSEFFAKQLKEKPIGCGLFQWCSRRTKIHFEGFSKGTVEKAIQFIYQGGFQVENDHQIYLVLGFAHFIDDKPMQRYCKDHILAQINRHPHKKHS